MTRKLNMATNEPDTLKDGNQCVVIDGVHKG